MGRRRNVSFKRIAGQVTGRSAPSAGGYCGPISVKMQWEGEGGGDFGPIPGMALGNGGYLAPIPGWVGPPISEFGRGRIEAGFTPARIAG